MITDAGRTRSNVRGGFTLPEATLAMVVLGMAAAGVLLPFVSGTVVQTEGLHRTLGARLANDLIEHVVATPFDQITAKYNYSEPQGQVKDASGTILTDPIYANFSRDIGCYEVYVIQQGGPPIAPNFILAFVRVYYRGEEIATINRLISE